MISPMLRTCETAIHVFKTHPRKREIKFVICPILKEGMNLCNDFCGTYERLRKYLDPLLKEHDLTFDFSLLFASFGLPDLAQIQITTDIPRF